MLERIVLHGEFSLFTVRGNFWYQIYQNQRQKILCQLMALITLTIWLGVRFGVSGRTFLSLNIKNNEKQ